MKKSVLLLVVCFLLFLGTGPLTHGAGFLIYEHGAAAMAMAGAFVAVANNPTAIFHNPAGLAWLDGTQISLGTTLITSKGSLSLPNWPNPTYQSVDQKSQVFYPSTFYLSHKINDRIVVGFGFFSPYGLGTEWPEDYPIKYIATKVDMKTFFFNPTIAVKMSDQFSVGFGVSYVYSTVTFDRVSRAKIIPGVVEFDIPLTLDGNGSRWAPNAGALYKGDNFSLGINWRGGFKIKFDGNIELTTSQVPSPFNLFIPKQGDGYTTFNFPHILGVGIAFNPSQKLLLSFDFHYVLWGTFDKYVIHVDYADPFPDPEPEEVKENWKDAYLFRGGFQYMLNENFALWAGILFDKTPQPVASMDPTLPDANRWAFTAGFGYKSGNFVIDAAYQLEFFNDRESPNREIILHPLTGANLVKGTYSTTAHLFGISLGFIF